MTFYRRNGTKSSDKVIFEELISDKAAEICSGCSAQVTLPPLTPTTLPNSGQRIMSISYDLKVVIETHGFQDNIVFRFPIKIGTVPLTEFVHVLSRSAP